MSFRKLKGEYHIRCDRVGCGASMNTQIGASKSQAWGRAKLKGWWAQHSGNLWRHYCTKSCCDGLDSQGEADQGARA